MARSADDWFGVQQPKLVADGWLFYDVQRYDPTIVRGYTPTVLPAGMANTAANRRRLNRPFYLWIRRSTANPADPWDGTLRFAAVSSLNPWVAGTTAPFGLEAQFAKGSGAHYLVDDSVNPVVFTEIDAARDAPVVAVTQQYASLDLTDDGNSLPIYNAARDLFARIPV